MDEAGVLQQLWEDHRVSGHLLGVVERCLPAAVDGDPESLRVLRDILSREHEYGDRVHHAREELLFERLASRDGSGRDAVKGLSHDHNELGRMGATLRDRVARSLSGHPADGALLGPAAGEYLEALRNHMRKEEQRVFPLAQRLLRQEDWTLVAAAFADHPDPLAPPAAAAYRDLEGWLERHGEVVFERPPDAR